MASVLSDDDLLALPGVTAALWWFTCPACQERVHGATACECKKPHPGVGHCFCGGSHGGDVQGLVRVDGRDVWVCRACLIADLPRREEASS